MSGPSRRRRADGAARRRRAATAAGPACRPWARSTTGGSGWSGPRDEARASARGKRRGIRRGPLERRSSRGPARRAGRGRLSPARSVTNFSRSRPAGRGRRMRVPATTSSAPGVTSDSAPNTRSGSRSSSKTYASAGSCEGSIPTKFSSRRSGERGIHTDGSSGEGSNHWPSPGNRSFAAACRPIRTPTSRFLRYDQRRGDVRLQEIRHLRSDDQRARVLEDRAAARIVARSRSRNVIGYQYRDLDARHQRTARFTFSQAVRPGPLIRVVCTKPGTIAPAWLMCSV